jgi:MerR family redox-sensitive transcriptional activator SoxR
MAEMTIGEVARRAGVEPSTLRYYESIGILPAPKRVSGQRRYSSDVLLRMAFIRVAKEAGFTMNDVQTLVDGFSEDTPPSERWRTLARSKLPEVEALIVRAQGMKRLLEEGLACDCLRLEECALFVDEPEGEGKK